MTRRGWTVVEFCLAWVLGFGMVSAAVLVVDAQVASGIATTTVSDTIYRADGTTAAGTVLVSWPAFVAATGATVPAGSTSVTLGPGGTLTLPLVANAGATPIGSYYTVVYHLSGSAVTREYWVVPVLNAGGAGMVKIAAIRNTVLPTSVAMQTVSKSYVDTAIATAMIGRPLDSSPYVVKAGDTMTGPLVLSGDPTVPLGASDKRYVDTQVAGVASGVAQKVSTLPQTTQVVMQPTGTQLQVNKLNGVEYASQYVTGAGNNGIANAASSPDCANGCDLQVEKTYASTEAVAAAALNNTTHVMDERGGSHAETVLNPLNGLTPGFNTAASIHVVSTQRTQDVHIATGAANVFSTGLSIASDGLAGGSNVFPQLLQGTVPYFKTSYGALNLVGTNNTLGQHGLVGETQDCYGVGDCLMGGMFMRSSGGFRDDADEGAHPFDLQFSEDQRVFTGVCAGGCVQGATVLQVGSTANGGTQGEGRYLIDKNPAKTITTGMLTGGAASGGRQPSASFARTNFAVSVLLETAQTIPTQANVIEPGTVTVPILTSGVPVGFATNTAALPSAVGVACVSDVAVADGRPLNFETAAYTVMDGSHLQMTLVRPHGNGATIAVGGLCGYGIEQTADTVNGIRQVFPVIASTSPTSILYAGGQTAIVGVAGLGSAFANVNLVVAAIARTNNLVTVTIAGNLPVDLNGLAVTVQGVTDPSYNGTFQVSTTASNVLTYASAGPNSTSAAGTLSYLNGGYVLYPMAEVQKVYNAATRAVDGQMTLAANTVNWAAGDAVEEPHYFQEVVSPDVTYVTQFEPRPSRTTSAGIFYAGNNGPGLRGWQIFNGTPASAYFGNGGSHSAPSAAMEVIGEWRHAMDMQAGDDAVFDVHCNSHGCNTWNSAYDLFQLDTGVGVDRLNFNPATSNLSLSLRGTNFGFTPQGFTAGVVNAGVVNAGVVNAAVVNATTLNGTLAGAVTAASLPLFGGSGAAHQVGAVPDPGATAGTTRFLREDGTWSAVAAAGLQGSMTSIAITPVNMPQRAALLGEYLMSEGTGTIAHDTSGQGNDGAITGAVWEGAAGAAVDLNFTATGEYVRVPVALNAARTWQFAVYQPVFGTQTSPQAQGYGNPSSFGGNPSLLCGTDAAHLCLIATSLFAPKTQRFLAFNTDSTEASEPMQPGWHIFTMICGSQVNGVTLKTHYLYDGAEVGSYIAQGDAGTCPNPTSGNYQIGGSAQYGGTWWVGKIAGTWAWSSALSLNDAAVAAKSAMEYIRNKGAVTEYRKAVTLQPMLLGGMDSRTYGVGLPAGADWMAQMQMTDATYGKRNFGIPGQLTYDGCAQFDLTYGAQISRDSGPVIVALWGGVNDQGFAARRTADSLKCMVQKAKAAGARVVLATEVSSYATNGGTSGDALKNGLNAVIRAEAFSWGADSIADLATDVHLGADGASAVASCFPDAVHPGPNCEPYITTIMQNAVNELIGSGETTRHTTAAASYQELAGDRFLDLTGSATQVVSLPDCTGYSLMRQVVNVGAAGATVATVNGQTLTGSGAVATGAKAVFLPVPGALAAAGCRWERTQ